MTSKPNKKKQNKSIKNLPNQIKDWGEKLTHLIRKAPLLKTNIKKSKAWVFLALLLAPVLVGRPRFCLVAFVGLTINLALSGVILIRGKVIVRQ